MTQNADVGKRRMLADFTCGRLLPAPRAAAPQHRETFYPVVCANPDYDNVRWLTKSNALKAQAEHRVCRHCQTSKAGKRGFEVTSARYGPDVALRWVRDSQIAHPSYYEVIVQAWLKELSAVFQPQVPFSATDSGKMDHRFVIDFVVETMCGTVAVEVNGYRHKRHGATRNYWLAQLYPGQVVFIDTEDIDAQPEVVKAQLYQLVRPSTAE